MQRASIPPHKSCAHDESYRQLLHHSHLHGEYPVDRREDQEEDTGSQNGHRRLLAVYRSRCSQAALASLGDHVATVVLGLLNFVDELGAGVVSSSCSRIYQHVQDSPSLASTSVPEVGSHPRLLSPPWRCGLPLGGSHASDNVLGIFVDELPRAM